MAPGLCHLTLWISLWRAEWGWLPVREGCLGYLVVIFILSHPELGGLLIALTSSHWLCGSSCLEREFREPQDLSPSSEARWRCQPFCSSSLPDPLLLILQGPAQTSPLRGAFPDPFLKVGPPSSPWPIPLCFLHSMFKSVLFFSFSPLSLLMNP